MGITVITFLNVKSIVKSLLPFSLCVLSASRAPLISTLLASRNYAEALLGENAQLYKSYCNIFSYFPLFALSHFWTKH